MARYKGNHPRASKGWVEIGETHGFVVYQQQQKNHDWITVKVVAETSAEGKANYWATYCITEDRFAYGRDFGLMAKSRPDLHEAAIKMIRAEFGR